MLITATGLAVALVVTGAVLLEHRAKAERTPGSVDHTPAPARSSPAAAAEPITPRHATDPGSRRTDAAPATNGTTLTGPGCPQAKDAWSGAQAHGDGWLAVGGGSGRCGRRALATYTTTSTTTTEDTYSWWFRTAQDAMCTLRIFVAEANTSSAKAHYEVYAAMSRMGGFDIVQARHRGEWVDAGRWKVTDGLLRVQLTDQADFQGAHHHVTAAAVSLTCD
jgi:hypothetical protein